MHVMVTLRESMLITALLSAFVMGFVWGYIVGHGNGRLDEITGRYKK
jgi:hypothetical protein